MNPPEKAGPQRLLFSRVFPLIGTVGLVITTTLNLVARFSLGKSAAEFFSHGWWESWFPSYVVWLAFLILGVAGMMMKKRSTAG